MPRPDRGPLVATPEGWDLRDVEQFLYREARLADENDYDGWEALWTDDASTGCPSTARVSTRAPTCRSSTTTAAGSRRA